MHIRLPHLSDWLPNRRTVQALALACLLAPRIASAAACEIPNGTPSDAELERLIDSLPACQQKADYLAALGNILNQRGRYVEAGDHLERALMLAPELKGARLDYAIALAGMGEIESARLLLEEIVADPDLPSHLKPGIERQLRNLASVTDWQPRVLLGARIGHDNNLLGSPDLNALTLTFPDQTVVLPLDESSRPKAGWYTRADLQLEARKQTRSGGQFESFFSLRTRRGDGVPEAKSEQGDMVLDYSSYQRRNSSTGFYIGASASSLRAGSGIRYNAYGIASGVGSSRWLAACDGRLGLETQERKFLNNDLLSGRYSGITTSFSCDRPGVQWLVNAKAGVDRAHHAERAGGDQKQYSVRGAFIVPTVGLHGMAKGRLWLDLELNFSRDSSGYSPLLESGRSRVMRRASTRIEYQHPISNSVQWIAGAEWSSQRSNIALFANRSWGPYLALRGAW